MDFSLLVCIWRCEHACFCVEVFYAIYFFIFFFIREFLFRPVSYRKRICAGVNIIVNGNKRNVAR